MIGNHVSIYQKSSAFCNDDNLHLYVVLYVVHCFFLYDVSRCITKDFYFIVESTIKM